MAELWKLESILEDAIASLEDARIQASDLYRESQQYEEKSFTYSDPEHGTVTMLHDVPVEGTGWQEMKVLADELWALKQRLENATKPFEKAFKEEAERMDYYESMHDATSY